MATTGTDIFLDEGDAFIPGTPYISGKDKHTVRLGGVTIYGSLSELTDLADSLIEAVEAHNAVPVHAS